MRRKTAYRTAASSLWVSGLNLVKIQSIYFDMFLFSLLDLLTVRSSSFVMLFILIEISSLTQEKISVILSLNLPVCLSLIYPLSLTVKITNKRRHFIDKEDKDK